MVAHVDEEFLHGALARLLLPFHVPRTVANRARIGMAKQRRLFVLCFKLFPHQAAGYTMP